MDMEGCGYGDAVAREQRPGGRSVRRRGGKQIPVHLRVTRRTATEETGDGRQGVILMPTSISVMPERVNVSGKTTRHVGQLSQARSQTLPATAD